MSCFSNDDDAGQIAYNPTVTLSFDTVASQSTWRDMLLASANVEARERLQRSGQRLFDVVGSLHTALMDPGMLASLCMRGCWYMCREAFLRGHTGGMLGCWVYVHTTIFSTDVFDLR